MTVPYHESESIFIEIQKARKILLATHISPDADSVGSCLAFFAVLTSLGKETTLLSCDPPPANLSFLPGFDHITLKDPREVSMREYDLFIMLDSADRNRVTLHTHGLELVEDLKIINIDHHRTNPLYGGINLVDATASSTGEILYRLFKNINVAVTSDVATCLLTAIEGDTGTFRYESTSADTLKIAGELMDLGAAFKEINFNLYKRTPFGVFKYWALVFEKMKIENEGVSPFMWVQLSEEEMKTVGGSEVSHGASDFSGNIEGTDFGVVIKEEEKGIITGSFRARTDINVAELASLFGGGGHKQAAGFRLQTKKTFQEESKRILEKVKEALR